MHICLFLVLCRRPREKYLKLNILDDTTSETAFQDEPIRQKCLGFFCNEAARFQDPLHEVSTENAGISLKKAILFEAMTALIL